MSDRGVNSEEHEEFEKLCRSQIDSTVCIDYDGVIAQKGGDAVFPTMPPVDGALEALRTISKRYTIILFTCRAREDRPESCIDELWLWLDKYGMAEYISEITAVKPRAKYYLDDKAGRFMNNWEFCLGEMGMWPE